jgi:hypothetical protein
MYGDQFEYAAEVMSLKTTGQSIENITLQNAHLINPITLTAKILGIVPIPNYMTVTSLAFVNKLFLLLTFLWFKRFFANENEVLLYFLIPSLILYSAMGLRDTLIIVISLVFIINLIRGRYLFAIPLLVPLFILKLQMFAFLFLFLLGRLVFRAHKNNYLLYFFISMVIVGAFILEDEILEVLNLYRLAFTQEDFVAFDGSISYKAYANYGQHLTEGLILKSIPEAIFKSVINLPVFLLIPMPWTWTSFFYPIQTLESCLLIYWYVNLARSNDLYKNNEFLLLTFILVLGLAVYALLMVNVGTFVRYRFALFYPFLLALFYLSEQSKKSLEKG